MQGAIAAGSSHTAEAVARVLEEGGNAVDACIAAAFAAAVAEGPLTGPTGGGFFLGWVDGEATLLEPGCWLTISTEVRGTSGPRASWPRELTASAPEPPMATSRAADSRTAGTARDEVMPLAASRAQVMTKW